MNLSAELDRWLVPATRELLIRVGHSAESLGCHAFLVGGPVRDMLLGRTSLDLDVVVEGDAPAVARAVVGPREPAPVTHPAFGTATITSGVFRIDLATSRAESYERPGALPAVRPGTIEQDLVRRDFTVNAMALALDGRHRGELLDPHCGRVDLDHGLLRVLHDGSFVDDATRILRGVRYEQRFGFAFDDATLELLVSALPYLDGISADRIRHELDRTFAEDEPERTMRRLDALGVLHAIHPALAFDERKEWAFDQTRKNKCPAAHVQALHWCLLTWGMPTGEADTLTARLNLSRRFRDAVLAAAGIRELEPELDNPQLSRSDVYALLSGFAHPALLAAELMSARPAARENVSSFVQHLRHVRPLLTGTDLRAMGVTDGPEMGRLLTRLRDARLNGAVSTREDEESLVRRLRAAAR